MPDAIRRRVWLDTDRTYKLAARRLIEIKSNQEVKVKDADGSADFSSEPPAVYQEPPPADRQTSMTNGPSARASGPPKWPTIPTCCIRT